MVLVAGPHFSYGNDVNTFFARNRDAEAIKNWTWPVDLGPMTHSLEESEIFRLLVIEANHQELQDEMLGGIRRQWNESVVKGMILGTEEFDRVGTVPYSDYDGIGAMSRVVEAVNLNQLQGVHGSINGFPQKLIIVCVLIL